MPLNNALESQPDTPDASERSLESRLLLAHTVRPTDAEPRLELRTISGELVLVAPLTNPLEESNDGHGSPAMAERSTSGAPVSLARWSGWREARSDTAAGLFEPSFATWSPPGWAAFEAWIAQRDAAVAGESSLVLRSHARHVLSDPQSVLSFMRRAGSAGLSYLFEPTALLTREMLGEAEDHLGRSFEALPIQPWCWGALLTGASVVETPWGRELGPCPIVEGVIRGETLARLAMDLLSEPAFEGRRIAILADQAEEQIALLRQHSADRTSTD